MHPLVPFLLGEPHPLGKRLVNFQKCIRTNDIDEVGDASHLTFFEMLGNWSLGDYFKQESLTWSFEFLTRVLGLDPGKLAVTVFAGDDDAPSDEESASIWRSLGIPAERIFYLPKSDNWWGPAGATGPCGPDSEIFFDTGLPDHPGCKPGCPCGKWLEIWNNVFMEYNQTADGKYLRLKQRNVDTGMGVERTVAVLNGLSDIFKVETMPAGRRQSSAVRKKIWITQPFRIIADHLRSATFAIADGAVPSNVEAGYVVRRMVRRAVRYGRELGIRENFCARLSESVVNILSDVYPALMQHWQIACAARPGRRPSSLHAGARLHTNIISWLSAVREEAKSSFRRRSF
jgi:alanyl-tRNA synthetase